MGEEDQTPAQEAADKKIIEEAAAEYEKKVEEVSDNDK